MNALAMTGGVTVCGVEIATLALAMTGEWLVMRFNFSHNDGEAVNSRITK